MGQSTSAENPPLVAGQAGEDVNKQNDGVTWWCKLLVKIVCVFSSGCAIFFGVWECLTFSPKCLVAGIFLMVAGFGVIVLEAPFCCQFLDFIKPLERFSENRTYWHKAVLYGVPPFIPFLLCHTLTTIMGCAMLLSSGVCYGMLALGRKADRDTMMARAGTDVKDDDILPLPPRDVP